MSRKKVMNLADSSQNLPDSFYSNNFQIQTVEIGDTEELFFKKEAFQISIILDKQKIFRNQAEISGLVELKTLTKMKNVPLRIQMTGWSSCVIDSQQKSIVNIDQKWKQVHIQNTFEDMLNQENEKSSKFNSSAFLQENSINQNEKVHRFSLQIFLQGQQTIYQLDEKINERLKTLQQKTVYKYPFLFMIPKNMPISMNKQILKGIHMIVQYWIYVSLQSQSQIQKKRILKKSFKIIGQNKQCPIEVLSNELKFKCFHHNGKLQEHLQEPSFFVKCFQNLSKLCDCFSKDKNKQKEQQKLKDLFHLYDLYHCQLIVTVNQNNVLHIVARVYLQPNQEQLNTHKQKIGNSYLLKKKQNPILLQQKTSQSKLENHINLNQEQINHMKADFAHIKMVGSIASIKDAIIFQRDVQLSRINYDMAQGEIMVAIQKGYQSQKNQLFEIKYRMFVDVHFKNYSQKNQQLSSKQQSEYQIKVINQKICHIPL